MIIIMHDPESALEIDTQNLISATRPYLVIIFAPPLGQDMTQGQFLSGV